MIKILFVCHGNICRSPMSQFVMQDLVNKKGLSHLFHIDSAATSTEEIGSGVHRGTRSVLKREGIPLGDHRAVQMQRRDYGAYDYLIGMDQWNIRNIQRIAGGDPEGKVFRLLDFTDHPRDIADPWYTGDFDETYEDVRTGCEALLSYLYRNLPPVK
ncbi:MAG: low molecular weight phosphotyrosine protein phosphatase [Lachnospiraceae bacterium]|nr:low molecular weight phosphotyrosine protein phosphatase [Lachnospiraceae bacterium]MCI8994526.1 low molecular weight phosphotyrosine protein phosphatase [Lachnospiraceae bacterium]